MKKEYKAWAKDNLGLDGVHTWTEGLDYQAFIGDGRIKIASNEGDLSFDESKIMELVSLFVFDEV